MSKFARLKLAPSHGDGDGTAQDDSLSPMDKRIERKLITPKLVAISLGVLVLIGLTGFGYWRYGLNRTLTVGAERLTVSTVEYGTFREYIPVTGNVVPKETVYLDAIEGGQVTELNVEEGAMVKAGDPLLRLKNTDLQINVINTETRVSDQINQLNSYKLNFEQTRLAHRRDLLNTEWQIGDLERKLRRNQQLQKSGAAKAADIEDLQAQLEYMRSLRLAIIDATKTDNELLTSTINRLQAETETLQKNLEITRENLDNLVVKAPISGQLTTFDAKVGQSLMKGARIGQIDEIDAFKVSAFVDEFYINRVVIGQIATVTVGGDDYTLEVAKIYPNVTDRQFQVDLLFQGDPPKGIRRGQTLRMNLEIGAESKSLILANGAYVDDTGGQWVFVVSPDGSTAERRDVTIGRRNPDNVEITAGLEKGERVITSGYDQLMDFDRIDLRKDNSN